MHLASHLYVDDIVLTGDDEQGISALKSHLHAHFETKDLGDLRYFLGVEVARKKGSILLSQRKYVMDILAEFNMHQSRIAESPMEPGLKLLADQGELLDSPEKYRRVVGKLNYLTTMTRPDLAYSVSVVSQFMATPRKPHWDAVLRILRYLRGSPGKGLAFTAHGHFRMESYTDADWAGSPTDRRSTSGYAVFVGGN